MANDVNYGAWGGLANAGNSFLQAYQAAQASKAAKQKMESEQALQAAQTSKAKADADQTNFENAPSTVSYMKAGLPDPTAGHPLQEKVGGLPILGPSPDQKFLTNKQEGEWSKRNDANKLAKDAARQNNQLANYELAAQSHYYNNLGGKDFEGAKKNFNGAKTAFDEAARHEKLDGNTGPADYQLLFNFIHGLDNSVVRESEVAGAAQTQGLAGRASLMLLNWTNGSKLTHEQRQQYMDLVSAIAQSVAQNHMPKYQQARKRAAERGIDPDFVTGGVTQKDLDSYVNWKPSAGAGTADPVRAAKEARLRELDAKDGGQ